MGVLDTLVVIAKKARERARGSHIFMEAVGENPLIGLARLSLAAETAAAAPLLMGSFVKTRISRRTRKHKSLLW